MFIYWALLTVGPILIGASLSLTSWLVSQSLGLVKDVPIAGVMLLKIVPMLLTGLAFALLYVTMPNRRVLARDALSGGFLAAIAFEGMKLGFAYLRHPVPDLQAGLRRLRHHPDLPDVDLPVVAGGAVRRVVGGGDAGMARARLPRSSRFRARSSSTCCRSCACCGKAHHTGEVVTLPRLHAIVKLPVDRIELILDTMSIAQWVGRVGRGWTLIRDSEGISVADVYHLFVFRIGARLPTRESGRELDRLALELAGGVENSLKLSLEELFRRAAAVGEPSHPGDQRPAANVLRLG